MLTRKTLRGVIPAIVTPFTAKDEVDEAALGAITEFVIKNGVHAIMTTGGTGEFPHLSCEERAVVTRAVVRPAPDACQLLRVRQHAARVKHWS
jgi:4-hydroxy-tetrahydrodipicolinate synthase